VHTPCAGALQGLHGFSLDADGMALATNLAYCHRLTPQGTPSMGINRRQRLRAPAIGRPQEQTQIRTTAQEA